MCRAGGRRCPGSNLKTRNANLRKAIDYRVSKEEGVSNREEWKDQNPDAYAKLVEKYDKKYPEAENQEEHKDTAAVATAVAVEQGSESVEAQSEEQVYVPSEEMQKLNNEMDAEYGFSKDFTPESDDTPETVSVSEDSVVSEPVGTSTSPKIKDAPTPSGKKFDLVEDDEDEDEDEDSDDGYGFSRESEFVPDTSYDDDDEDSDDDPELAALFAQIDAETDQLLSGSKGYSGDDDRFDDDDFDDDEEEDRR